MNRRIDKKTALLIDAAVNAAASHGLMPAACELVVLGVPLHVAVRVLTMPTHRRSYSLAVSDRR